MSNKRAKTDTNGNGGKVPKVLVSGCFDLLHSGHVEFFKEAAKQGELHVRCGSDANIRSLKNHAPMYTEQERVYMAENVQGVHAAAVSNGTGRFDFLTDIQEVQPDIYFVNDDASKLDERIKLVEDLKICKVVVAERKPSDGLEVRSSTSMKSRLKEMVMEDVKESEAAATAAANSSPPNMDMFHQTLPWRFCFIGGWMDLKWVNEHAPGCAITINIKFNPGICKDECGLATSSRKVAAKLWNGKVPDYLTSQQAAEFLWAAENFHFHGTEKRPYCAGSQDHWGLMFPGINKLCYGTDGSEGSGRHIPNKIISLNDPTDPEQAKIFSWLESVLYIIDIPFVSRPEGYSSQRINHLKDPAYSKAERVKLVKPLAQASEDAWAAICNMDSTALGKALSDTMAAWKGMLPYTVDPYLGDDDVKTKQVREFVAKYDAPNTKGCLFSGAGGGFLMVVSDTPIKEGMKVTLNHDFFCKPHPSNTLAEAR